MQAARSNTNVNVLSSPNILTTDNEEAEIVVGQNVPFLASTASSADNLNNTFNQIDRQDVGITLRITPQISSSDFVTLNLFTEVSNVIASTAGSDLGPTTTVRTSNTTVIAKDGQMIVTGGLMSDNITETEEGVPYIKDIPLLGHLFKSRGESQQKTNLLIFLTPSIIQDQFDARDETLDRSDKLGRALDDLELYPRRQEVLKNPDLDAVIEGKVYEGTLPGTIFQPKEGTKNPNVNPKLMDTQESTPKARKYKINPSLPSSAPSVINSNAQQDLVTNKAMNELRHEAPQQPSRFVVLQAEGSNMNSASIPFVISNNKLAVIAVPNNSPQNVLSFFKSGDRYSYSTGSSSDEKTRFRVMGIFDERAEASEFYSGLPGAAHSLSAYESMNLGKGPWIRG